MPIIVRDLIDRHVEMEQILSVDDLMVQPSYGSPAPNICDLIRKFVAAPILEAIAAEEREACAKIAEAEGENPGPGWGGGSADVGHSIAAAIRARDGITRVYVAKDTSTPVPVDPAVAIDYDASAGTVR